MTKYGTRPYMVEKILIVLDQYYKLRNPASMLIKSTFETRTFFFMQSNADLISDFRIFLINLIQCAVGCGTRPSPEREHYIPVCHF